jgi:hypothetical protein
MEEEGANAVIKGTKNALDTTVLLRGVWASEAENGAVRGKKGADGGVVEFFPVISLESVYGAAELGGHVGVEGGKGGGDVGLFAEGKSPHKVRVVIKNNKIIEKTRITSNWRGPYITMN